jgi:hypothetical protein
MLEGFPSGAYTFRPAGVGQNDYVSYCHMEPARSRA